MRLHKHRKSQFSDGPCPSMLKAEFWMKVGLLAEANPKHVFLGKSCANRCSSRWCS